MAAEERGQGERDDAEIENLSRSEENLAERNAAAEADREEERERARNEQAMHPGWTRRRAYHTMMIAGGTLLFLVLCEIGLRNEFKSLEGYGMLSSFFELAKLVLTTLLGYLFSKSEDDKPKKGG
ncbi:MAG: hypothetical protein LBD02_00335 [Christensenellaceae bacterium]|jgi:hypothetical protein|nr:hypothetical protein [Christensenellaceae bacterium]